MCRFLSKAGLSLKQWMLLLCLIVGVAWSLNGVYTMYMHYSQSKAEFVRSQEALAELQARQDELQRSINNLETSRGVESELRTRFNASKDGEELIVIVTDKNQATAGDVLGGSSWWQKVKDWLR